VEEKPIKDLQIIDLERQLKVLSTEQQVWQLSQ